MGTSRFWTGTWTDSSWAPRPSTWISGRRARKLTEALHATVEQNGMTDGAHVRLMITRGTKKTPSQDPRLTVGGPTIVIIAEHKRADPDTTRAGVQLFTATIRRPPPDTLDQKLNCHSKLHEVIALVQALHAGADEALMLDPEGFVATCNATNFFVVRGGEVWTSTGQYCLNGITRGVVVEVGRENGIPVHEAPFSLADVYSAEEAFVTGTFGGLTPVIEVDGADHRHRRARPGDRAVDRTLPRPPSSAIPLRGRPSMVELVCVKPRRCASRCGPARATSRRR